MVTGPTATAEVRYLTALTLVAVFALIAKNLVRGRVGRSWMAVRDRDIAAEIIGIRPLRTKLLAFSISSFYCGVAGAEFVFLYLDSVDQAWHHRGRRFPHAHRSSRRQRRDLGIDLHHGAAGGQRRLGYRGGRIDDRARPYHETHVGSRRSLERPGQDVGVERFAEPYDVRPEEAAARPAARQRRILGGVDPAAWRSPSTSRAAVAVEGSVDFERIRAVGVEGGGRLRRGRVGCPVVQPVDVLRDDQRVGMA
jgi:hypothetical protein